MQQQYRRFQIRRALLCLSGQIRPDQLADAERFGPKESLGSQSAGVK